jgi:hypothetical protein
MSFPSRMEKRLLPIFSRRVTIDSHILCEPDIHNGLTFFESVLFASRPFLHSPLIRPEITMQQSKIFRLANFLNQ